MENKLIFKGTQNLMDKEIPVVYGGFGENQKCISDKTVAELHNTGAKKVREVITNNVKRFKKNIDFIDLKQRARQEGTLELLLNIGYAKQSITQAEHIYILSKRGYAKLIKIFDTDLAWEVYEKLLDQYFYFEQNQSQSLIEYDDKIQHVEQRIEKLEDTMTIDYGQQNDLRMLGNSVVVNALGGYETNAYKAMGKKVFARLWKDYKIYFRVNSYKNTPRKRYFEAQDYIVNWHPDANTSIMIKKLNAQKEVGALA